MKAILACTKTGGIGKDGSMPWPKDSKDLKRFKELTLNTTILMGRGTWESSGMPKPLPNRQNIVVSSQSLTLPDNVLRIDDVTNIANLKDDLKIDWCIGGAKLFNSLIQHFDEIHLTRIRGEYECDTHIDLDEIENHFYCAYDQMCVSHSYQIWKKR